MYKTLFVKSFVENIFEWRMLCCIEQGSRCEQEEEVKGMEKRYWALKLESKWENRMKQSFIWQEEF